MSRAKKNTNDPLPLAKRICECGCGHEFQPTRSDQRHLNSKHYDFAYNHGPRKEKYAEEKDTTKIIRKNDRILEKYFRLFQSNEVKLNFVIVLADGFDDTMYTRIIAVRKLNLETKYHALYKYCYSIIKQGDINYILIRKL
jgi:hypothetical protein